MFNITMRFPAIETLLHALHDFCAVDESNENTNDSDDDDEDDDEDHVTNFTRDDSDSVI